MSREHLYKAKRVNWRELPKEEWWVEGDLIHEPYGTVIQYYEDEIKDKGNCAKTSKKKRIKAFVEPETVCEYTGLTDKNDRKIFEGDIIKYGDSLHKVVFENRFGTAYFGVVFEDRGEVWSFGHSCSPLDMTVIGNIFDNQELLKGGVAE